MSAVCTQREADEARVRQQVARIVQGIRAKDLEGLRLIYAAGVVSFDVKPLRKGAQAVEIIRTCIR